MKRFLIVSLLVAVLAVLAGAALAHGPGGWSGGGMGMGPGMMGMGPGMMGGTTGQTGCPGMTVAGAPGTAAQLTEEKARELAAQYAEKYLKGFTVERVLPFAGMHMVMYQAELKGPQGEARLLHINPWGGVMPFGGPMTR